MVIGKNRLRDGVGERGLCHLGKGVGLVMVGGMRRMFLLMLGWGVSQAIAAFDVQRVPTPLDAQAMQTMGWRAAAEELEAVLVVTWKPSHFAQAGSSSNPTFQQWLRLAQWARLLGMTEPEALRSWMARRVVKTSDNGSWSVVGPGLARPEVSGLAAGELPPNWSIPPVIAGALWPEGYVLSEGEMGERLSPALALELANDPAFLEEFFRELSPEDYAPGVLLRLQELRAQLPAAWPEYRSLMLALAMVYDQQMPEFWPHHQVASNAVPRDGAGVTSLFDYFYRANEARRTEHDLRGLGVGELKFVVDAPVEVSELEWAAKNVRTAKSQFAKVFEMVSYDHERAKQAEYVWPEGTDYRLATILGRGGICTDQAYFASLAGKAKGIPTLYFAGQGKDGGHAWFGFLRGGGRWEMDAGRYLRQNYTTGLALDPQTWLPISDHELLFLSKTEAASPSMQAARVDLAMTELFLRRGDLASAELTSESAWRAAQDYLAAWELRERVLAESGSGDKLREFYGQGVNYFRRNEGMRVRFQSKLAELARTGGDHAAARELEARMVRENRRERVDLSATAGGEVLNRLLGEGDYVAAMREYSSLTRRLGRTGGGSFFYEIVQPFVGRLRQLGRDEDAERALREARRVMPMEAGSILAREFAELAAGA